jgi:tetratricopeptide (TPR) repeat protein
MCIFVCWILYDYIGVSLRFSLKNMGLCFFAVILMSACNDYTEREEAMHFFATGEYEKSGDRFQKLSDSNPQNDTLKYFTGLCRMHSQNYGEAVEIFSELIDDSSSYALSAYFGRGSCFFKSEDYENAIKDFTVCIKRDNIDPYPVYYRACCYYLIDMKALAKKDWYKALSLGFDMDLDYNFILENKRDIELLSN